MFISNNSITDISFFITTFLWIICQRHVNLFKSFRLMSYSNRRIFFTIIFKNICNMMLVSIETKLIFCHSFISFTFCHIHLKRQGLFTHFVKMRNKVYACFFLFFDFRNIIPILNKLPTRFSIVAYLCIYFNHIRQNLNV